MLAPKIHINRQISAPTVTFSPPAKDPIIRESKVVAKGVSWQIFQALLTSEFQRGYKPPDLSVESIPNRKSKIPDGVTTPLKPIANKGLTDLW